MNDLKEPLVSVIIPCYNVGGYVQQAIHSILKQSYKNLEIWIIDDASTDDTLEKINAIKDNRIKVIALKENTQKIGAVNQVLQKVNGNYIAFQDADDWSEPNRIEEQVKEFIKDQDLGICFTNFRYINLKKTLPENTALSNNELRSSFLNFYGKSNNVITLPMCPSMMISKVVLNKTKGYHPYFMGRVAEDIHWIYRILKDFKGITVDETLYNYKIRTGSLTQIQYSGVNAKFAYSWHLLSKIIHKDIYEGIDVLEPENIDLLKTIELEACEEALLENIQLLQLTKKTYTRSTNYRLGRFLLSPLHFIKSLKK